VTQWAPVASAGAAALAAAASWVAVLQSRRAWTAERLPEIQMQALVDPSTRKVSVQVYNAGGGLGRDVVVFLVEGDRYLVANIPPHGMLAPGRGVLLETPLVKQGQLTGRMVGVAVCSDSARTVHAWTAGGGGYKRWRPGRLRKKPVSNFDVFRALVPDVDIESLDAVTASGWHEVT